jgi:dethiobiotin synthetase
MSPRERVVLIGTGTGIGKTHLGVTLLRALAAAGIEAAGLKPVESGVGTGTTSDSALLAEAALFHVKRPPPYAFEAAVSPHLAAERAGLTIQLGPIVRWVDDVEAPWAVIETAGALLSPLSSTLTNLDLVAALAPTKVVLVAPDRLGVLHDVTAALFAYRVLAPRLPEPVVALLPPAEADTSTGLNAGELLGLEIARAVVTFLRAPPDAPEMLERAAGLLQLLSAPPWG